MRSPWKIPCATPAWGAWSLWTMSHPSENRLHHQFHRSVKTSCIIFDTIITAGSWAEWNVFHLAKNGSQVQFRTSAKGGPSWQDVEARVTLDASTGHVIKIEAARDITRECEHRLLLGGPCDIVTLLIWSNPTIVSGLRLILAGRVRSFALGQALTRAIIALCS